LIKNKVFKEVTFILFCQHKSRKDNQKSINLISSNLILGIHTKAFISKLFYKQSIMKWVTDQVKIEINDKNKRHYLLPCT